MTDTDSAPARLDDDEADRSLMWELLPDSKGRSRPAVASLVDLERKFACRIDAHDAAWRLSYDGLLHIEGSTIYLSRAVMRLGELGLLLP